MSTGTPATDTLRLKTRYLVRGTIRFETAWRIGTGREGQTMSDLGLLLDPEGLPVLPGSSLKGKLRATCESLSHALNLRACGLDAAASGVECASDIGLYSRTLRPEYDALLRQHRDSVGERLAWIDRNTCDVCKLFGSPVKTSRLRLADGLLVRETWAGVVQVRDGVVIDRDSRTAVDGLKYDYEVVPAGTAFGIRIDLEDPTDAELALVGAALFEWSAGSSLGGFTSRGLGRFRFVDVSIAGVDFSKPSERVRYLTRTEHLEKLTDRGAWEPFFQSLIERQANTQPPGGGLAGRD